MADTEQSTPTLWDRAWTEGHAHGLMNALHIPYHDAYVRTVRMLHGEPLMLTPSADLPACRDEDLAQPAVLAACYPDPPEYQHPEDDPYDYEHAIHPEDCDGPD